jgi:hypothetical protein
MRIHLLLLSAIFALLIAPSSVCDCSCVQPPPGYNPGQWAPDSTDAIFEGRVASIDLKGAFLKARNGDVIPTGMDDEDSPFTLVSFSVTRTYQNIEQETVGLRTGLGGGDCGFHFEHGPQYLVFAHEDKPGDLQTNICSDTALLDESTTKLAYLRREPVISDGVGKPSMNRGELRGRVSGAGLDFSDSRVLVFQAGNKSFVPSGEAQVAKDGSFLTTGVIPGKYYLVFMSPAEESPTAFEFYPGVSKASEATMVEVSAGQDRSELVFKIASQSTFSVSGNVLAPSKSTMPTDSKVVLMNADPLSHYLAYSQDVAPNGSFDFPQVLPGKYWTFISVDSDGPSKWLTRKVEVNVEGETRNVLSELIAK